MRSFEMHRVQDAVITTTTVTNTSTTTTTSTITITDSYVDYEMVCLTKSTKESTSDASTALEPLIHHA